MSMAYLQDEGYLFRVADPVFTNMQTMHVWTDLHGWMPVEDPETRSHAVWFGIPVPPGNLPEKKTLRRDLFFDESAHPRDEHGKFTDGEGGGGVIASSSMSDHDTALQSRLVDFKADRALTGPDSQSISEAIPGAQFRNYVKVPGLDQMHAAMGITPTLATDPVEYQAARSALFKKQPVENVPFEKIIYTQPRVNKNQYEKLSHTPEYFEKPVNILKKGDKYYVMNGHHRVVAAHSVGRAGVNGYVLDVDTLKKDLHITNGEFTRELFLIFSGHGDSERVFSYRERLAAYSLDFDPDQARDETGKWTSDGGGSAGTGGAGSDDPELALDPDAPRGGEGQQALFEYEPEDGSLAALRKEANQGIAAVEEHLEAAIKNADFENGELANWESVDLDDQQSVFDKWSESEYSETYATDAGMEAGERYLDDKLNAAALGAEVADDPSFANRLSQKVGAVIDVDSIGFDTEQIDTYDRTLHAVLDTERLRTADGEPLTDEQQDAARAQFHTEYLDARENRIDVIRESDGYREAVDQASREAIESTWDDKDDSEKMSIAKDYGIGQISVEPGEPDNWKFDSDSPGEDEDYIRTRAIALELVKSRTTEIFEERGLESNRKNLPETIGDRLWDEWKSSSQSNLGLAMQMAVADELGTLPTAWLAQNPQKQALARMEMVNAFTTSEERQALRPSAPSGPDHIAEQQAAVAEGQAKAAALAEGRVKAYVRAQWETTQFILEKSGAKDVESYRAVMVPRADLEATTNEPFKTGYSNYTKLPELKLLQNSIASATSKASVANEWNGVDVKDKSTTERVVLRFRSPREGIFSLPVYGQNVHEESEIVQIGTKGLQWDAWRREAPDLTHARIDNRFFFSDTKKGKSIVVDMATNSPTHWLKGWRKHKTRPLPPKRSTHDKLKKVVTAIHEGIDEAAKTRNLSDWDEDAHPRDEAGKFTDGGGGKFTDGGGGSARTFTSEEGYQWHEEGPVAKWAEEIPYAEAEAIRSYASFGYGDMNRQLRGTFTPNIVNETVRDATPEEIAAFQHPPFFNRGHASDYKDDDPLNKVEDGRIVHDFHYVGGYKPEGPNERVDTYKIERAGPDVKYVKEIEAKAALINTTIRERGYELPEAITVHRAAYIPGLSFEDLKAKEGELIKEKGFTSTMLGDAGNRLTGYVAMGKAESIYKRFEGKPIAENQDEVGVAMRIAIKLPEGTKVAAVEPIRRIEHEFPRVVVPLPDHVKDDPYFKEHPEAWTERDYTAKPAVKTDMLRDKTKRSESEILIGSGANYRVLSVEKAEKYNTGDRTLKPVQIIDVVMEYVGGGSSDGNVDF